MILALIFNVLMLVIFLLLAVGFVIHIIQEATSNAPFIPISKEALSEIIKALELKEGSVVYDLGSGNGRVVFAVSDYFPNIKVVGVERSFLPYILSCITKFTKKYKNTKFIQTNFFNVSVAPATHIFIYLFPSVINELLVKLEKELAPGTRVISCDFGFKDKEPVSVIRFDRAKYSQCKKIYIYEF